MRIIDDFIWFSVYVFFVACVSFQIYMHEFSNCMSSLLKCIVNIFAQIPVLSKRQSVPLFSLYSLNVPGICSRRTQQDHISKLRPRLFTLYARFLRLSLNIYILKYICGLVPSRCTHGRNGVSRALKHHHTFIYMD